MIKKYVKPLCSIIFYLLHFVMNFKILGMKEIKLMLEITELPKGIFTAHLEGVRGAVVQGTSEDEVIEEIFKQAWLCIKVDRKNFIVA